MYDVITIGAGTADVFLRSKLFQVVKSSKFITGLAECFAFGSKVDVDEMYMATGGGGTNCATTFARAGYKTAWFGNIGNDIFGDVILNDLNKEKVATELVGKVDRPSGYSNILLTTSGQRTILVYRGASEHWQKPVPLSKLQAKWFYITSLGGDLALLERILDYAEEHAINIAINPGAKELKAGWEALSPLLERVHILVLNREEAANLANKPYGNLKAIYKKLSNLTQQCVVVTEGPKGATACDGYQCYNVGIYKVKVVEATGAGDAFGSGFVAEFMKKGNVERALQYAVWNSSNVVAQIGAKAGIIRSFPKKPLRVKMS